MTRLPHPLNYAFEKADAQPDAWDETDHAPSPEGGCRAMPYPIGWEDEEDDTARASEAMAEGRPKPVCPARTFEACPAQMPAERAAPPVAPAVPPLPSPAQAGGAADRGQAPSMNDAIATTKAIPKRRTGPARQSAAATPIPLPHAKKLDYFPALFSRSALFRVGGADEDPDAFAGPAAAIAIPAQGAVNLTLSGPWPRMRDKEVWEVALQLAKEAQDPSAPIRISLSDCAARLGRSDRSASTLDSIWRSLRRLALCRIEFDLPSAPMGRLGGNLLQAAREVGKRREIEVDLAFANKLLADESQFAINRQRRSLLSTALARWLHDFMSTHTTKEAAFVFEIRYLRELCGYGANKKRFPAALELALKELAQKAPEVLAGYAINKLGKSSDDWTGEVSSGSEKRLFQLPKAHGGAQPVRPKPTGRGGVSL